MITITEKFRHLNKTQQIFTIFYRQLREDQEPWLTIEALQHFIESLSRKTVNPTYTSNIVTFGMSLGLLERRGRHRDHGMYMLTEMGRKVYENLELEV